MRSRLLLTAVIVMAAAFRFAIVREYSSTSPDGRQYYALARSLVLDGRYAFGPPPRPLTYSRLPGYPIFLGAVAVGRSLTEEQTVHRAAYANVLLDLLTAALLALMLRELGFPPWSGGVAFALVALCPLLFLFSVYSLTESLTTFLGTLTFWLALRSRRGASRGYAAASGLVAGLAMLVRADMITLVPALALLVCGVTSPAATPRRRRAELVAVLLLFVAVAVAPWAVRNIVRFGAPHLAGAEWPAQDGEPLPTGPMKWMRTWAAGRPGDGDLSSRFVFRSPAGPADLRPVMYDSDAERRDLVALLERYSREGLTPAVDDAFAALASRRLRAHPLRTLIGLPLVRACRLYDAPPRGDYPIRVGFLGLPRWRDRIFDGANVLVYLGAIAGFIVLWRRRRDVAIAVAAAIAGRTLLHMWAVPTFVCQRYLIEVVPLMLLCGAMAIVCLAQAAARGRAT